MPASPGLPPPPPASTPTHFDAFLHPRHVYVPHPPSRLGQSETKEPHWPVGSPLISAPSSAPMSPHSTQGASPTDDSPPPLSLPPPVVEPSQVPSFLHAPKPVTAPVHYGSATTPPGATSSGAGTPKAKFLQTLDSKSAWDALIHGSFS
ncbi:hypothetical protein H0H81_001276 [Sphagnurus paluster]|uniref:Uncharacterized protein n=1 Tax=Sphagnurus paluster TaxID=117069 RepID=A0A9P7GK25_9AGAR|nr:hypothetical protein H0H81_001276 [Sphagnurus paluster]